MGFIYEKYNDNHCTLIASFQNIPNSETYFSGDSISDAINYFNMYIKNNELYIHTPDELTLEATGIETVEEANDLREKINTIISNFTDEEALDYIILFPRWTIGKQYNVGEKIRYNGGLYKILQAHTSQETWTPDIATSLYARILTNEDDTPAEWVQPDSTNAYMIGDRVIFEGQIYESLIDNNTWSPAAYPAGWQLIEE